MILELTELFDLNKNYHGLIQFAYFFWFISF